VGEEKLIVIKVSRREEKGYFVNVIGVAQNVKQSKRLVINYFLLISLHI
jgi:hypothetical protein